MGVCTCVYMCVCIYVYMYVCTCVCVYIEKLLNIVKESEAIKIITVLGTHSKIDLQLQNWNKDECRKSQESFSLYK